MLNLYLLEFSKKPNIQVKLYSDSSFWVYYEMVYPIVFNNSERKTVHDNNNKNMVIKNDATSIITLRRPFCIINMKPPYLTWFIIIVRLSGFALACHFFININITSLSCYSISRSIPKSFTTTRDDLWSQARHLMYENA